MTAKFPITPRQLELLTTIKRLIATTGFSPTHKELAKELGISCAAVQQILKRLTQRGHVRRLPSTQRTLMVVDDSKGKAA